IRCPVDSLGVCRVLRGRSALSCRLRPASFGLTMRSLSQAPRLGGLHRASRLPFKVSFFTSAEHPANATTQRLIAHLIWAMETLVVIDPCFISSSRLVAHALQSIGKHDCQGLALRPASAGALIAGRW